MLPKGDRYDNGFDELMNDIGALSSRQLVYSYERESVYEAMASRMQHVSIGPESSYTQPNPSSVPATPQSRAYSQTPATRRSNLRFSSAVRQTIIPLNDEATVQEPRALPQTPSRQPPPHMPLAPPNTPQTPAGPLSSVASRVLAFQAPQAMLPNGKVDDSPAAVADYQARRDEWHRANGPKRWPSSRRPYPLSPGTFEQTLDLCPRCGKENHTVLECTVREPYTVVEHERKYRESVQRKLAREADLNRRAGAQPETPTPPQRYQDTQQVEYSEAETDFESVAGSSGKE